MKKIVPLLMILLLAVSLVGFSNGQTTETPEQRTQRMINQFGAGEDIPRIGIYFTEGVDKEEAKKTLATYGLELMKVQVCESSGPEEANRGVETQRTTNNENCRLEEEWTKIVETDKEYYGKVEVKNGNARRIAELLAQEQGIYWIEPDKDSYATNEQNTTQETKTQKMQRMLNAFDRTNIRKGYLIVSFTKGTTKRNAEDILAKEGFNIEEWIDSIDAATVKVNSGTEKETAKILVTNEKIIWVEPDYKITVAEKNSNNTDQTNDTGLFQNIWNWIKSLFR